MKTDKDLKALSDSELDDLIQHGINQQETVPRHSEAYQHHLNVIAGAKEEKAQREHAKTKDSGKDLNDVADGIEDDKVKDMNHGQTTDVKSPKGEPVKGETPKPKPASPQPDEIPADKINQGIPGVKGGAATDTPENTVIEPA